VSRRRILLVGGRSIAAERLQQRLPRLGYEVSAVADSGRDAVAATGFAAPEIALIEAALAGDMDSTAVAGEIQRRRRIPTLFMITEQDETAPGWAQVVKRDGCIVMPCSDRELRAGIELALCRTDGARSLHELEDRFFGNSIDMICFLDFNGHFKRLNPAWERTLGFTRAELMSKPFIEFVHPDDRERTLNQNRAVREGGQALSFENRYLCKDGSYRWLRWNASPDAGERVIYSVARDVTESKAADDERELLVRELQAALVEVKSLRAILPICSYCRKIRDDEDYWHTVEQYVARHTSTRFSHGICPTCMETEVEPQLRAMDG
jgi:PAS domain S-box-containing protein